MTRLAKTITDETRIKFFQKTSLFSLFLASKSSIFLSDAIAIKNLNAKIILMRFKKVIKCQLKKGKISITKSWNFHNSLLIGDVAYFSIFST